MKIRALAPLWRAIDPTLYALHLSSPRGGSICVYARRYAAGWYLTHRGAFLSVVHGGDWSTAIRRKAEVEIEGRIGTRAHPTLAEGLEDSQCAEGQGRLVRIYAGSSRAGLSVAAQARAQDLYLGGLRLVQAVQEGADAYLIAEMM